MKDSIGTIHASIAELFPYSHIMVYKQDTSILDNVTVRFTIERKEDWRFNIFHNAQYLILMINEKNKRYETGEGPYEVEAISTINYT